MGYERTTLVLLSRKRRKTKDEQQAKPDLIPHPIYHHIQYRDDDR